MAQAELGVGVDHRPFNNVFQTIASPNMFNPPVAYFKFPNLSDDQKARLNVLGLEYEPISKAYRGSPLSTFVPELFTLGAHNARQVPGSANCDGYLAYIMSLKALRTFCFFSKAGKLPGVYLRIKENPTTGVHTVPGHGTIGTMVDTTKSIATGVPTTAPASVIIYSPVYPVIPPLSAVKGIPSTNISPTSKVTDPGLVFPYFHGLLLPDREFMIPIFQRLFFRCMGSTADKAQTTWIRVKAGLRNIAATSAGLCLQHAFFGILLAENAQCELSLIVSQGNYKGFLLSGSDFNIIHNNQILEPVLDVRPLLKAVSIHDVSLQEIVDLIRTATYVSGVDSTGADMHEIRYKVSLDDVNTSRRLWATIRSIDWDFYSNAEKTSLKDLVDKLQYGDNYVPVKRSTILAFLSYVNIGDRGLLKDYPAYISSSTLFAEDRITNGLGIFGPVAPSVNIGIIGKEQRFDFPTEGKNDKNLEKVDEKFVLRLIPYKMKPLPQAASEWIHMLNNGFITIPNPRVGVDEFSNPKGRDGAFTGEDVQVVYLAMKKNVNMLREQNRGQKRKAPAEADTVRQVKISKKAGVSEMEL